MKPNVIVDPHFRKMDETFSPDDLARLHDVANVIWGKDEPISLDIFMESIPED